MNMSRHKSAARGGLPATAPGLGLMMELPPAGVAGADHADLEVPLAIEQNKQEANGEARRAFLVLKRAAGRPSDR